MHSTRRTTLIGALLSAFVATAKAPWDGPLQALSNLRAHIGPPAPRGRARRSRGGKVRGAVPRLFCKAAAHKPVKYTQASPKTVTGVRLRWQKGQLVPRDTVQTLPPARRQAERLARKRRQLVQKTRRPAKHGGNRRGDMKGAMRAARRAGIITARQQRLIHRGIRAGGYAPETLLKMLALEDRRNPEVVA